MASCVKITDYTAVKKEFRHVSTEWCNSPLGFLLQSLQTETRAAAVSTQSAVCNSEKTEKHTCKSLFSRPAEKPVRYSKCARVAQQRTRGMKSSNHELGQLPVKATKSLFLFYFFIFFILTFDSLFRNKTNVWTVTYWMGMTCQEKETYRSITGLHLIQQQLRAKLVLHTCLFFFFLRLYLTRLMQRTIK